MITTNLVEIHPIKDGIIYNKVQDEKDFTPEELIKTYKIFEDISKGAPYKVILDARDITVGHIPTESFRLNSRKKYNPNQKAEAYIFNSLHTRLLINFYFKLFKPVIPSKMFETREEAEKWLAEIDVNSN